MKIGRRFFTNIRKSLTGVSVTPRWLPTAPMRAMPSRPPKGWLEATKTRLLAIRLSTPFNTTSRLKSATTALMKSRPSLSAYFVRISLMSSSCKSRCILRNSHSGMCFISFGTLAVKIFLRSMRLLCSDSIVKGFSTNGKNSKKKKCKPVFCRFFVPYGMKKPFFAGLLTTGWMLQHKLLTGNQQVFNRVMNNQC